MLQGSSLSDPAHEDIGYGRHRFTYTVTTAGVHWIESFVAAAGGVHATYYASHDLTQPIYRRQDQSIDFSGAGTEQAPFDWPSSPSQPMQSNSFSTRWHGFIRAQHDQTYTFTGKFDLLRGDVASDERIRLWIDNTVVIDLSLIHI